MHHYTLFGGHLASELPFPELVPVAEGSPDWTLRVGRLAPEADGELLHQARHTASCSVRLTRAGDGYRYAHSCTGTFEVSADGRTITWDGVPGAAMDVVRMDVLARVLLLCISSDAVICLHGSAVIAPGGALGFLGHSGAGKTTLAMAVARAGAVHLADDTVPIALETVPSVWAGDATVRVRGDTASHFGTTNERTWHSTSDGKSVVVREALPAGNERAPLAALYVIDPVRVAADSVEPPSRRLLDGVAAVMALIPHVRTAAIARGERSAGMLEQVSRLVENVPVYAVRVPRGWERLDHVAGTILGWHGGAVSLEGAAT